ncbi:xylulokinase [Vibrio aphrogenes]|uniref:xylulokinase n=1 Tax=Vibrio aphrogenes TaxID=1891186 RepID=UPI000B34E7FD|nr:xylulokinase [Vibrio aphrogenes]
MFIGIDLGTSGVKVILLNSDGNIISTQHTSLTISRPHPLWSEQHPDQWWEATQKTLDLLSEEQDLSQVQAIGLSGQMHGATLLDKDGNVIRPAILWNDGRCEAECKQLEELVPNSRIITGNIMMPGFTAPKIKWVQQHEPDNFNRLHKVLLPKDYLRYKLCGIFASDMSDSAGTMWLDIQQRDWNDELLSATGVTRDNMPNLFEGNQITGHLFLTLAKRWGMSTVPIVAGAGDNAAGAIGVGIINPGQAMLSLGTSGVYFAASDGFISNPESALHSFCHALPNTWHTMSVILSAASCLDWVAKITNMPDVSTLLANIQNNANPHSHVLFLPYLSGERTPHNNPNAQGLFFGMTHETTAADLGLAVLEGVGFALADGFDALHVTKFIPKEVCLIGGGARSAYWRQMLSDITGMTLVFREGGDVGPALGAARLAQLAVTPNADLNALCPIPTLIETHVTNSERYNMYQLKRAKFQKIYHQVKNLF